MLIVQNLCISNGLWIAGKPKKKSFFKGVVIKALTTSLDRAKWPSEKKREKQSLMPAGPSPQVRKAEKQKPVFNGGVIQALTHSSLMAAGKKNP